MRPRARLIYNPTSGNEGMRRYVADILDVLEQAGYEASAFQTTAEPFPRKKRPAGQLRPGLR